MIFRFDVRSTLPGDGGGETLRREIGALGISVGNIAVFRVYLIDADAGVEEMRVLAGLLVADPIVEVGELFDLAKVDPKRSRIEVHLKPGVMDPVAASTEAALRDLGLNVRQVRTGRAFVFSEVVERSKLETIASRILANGVIESVHFEPFLPGEFETGREYQFAVKHVSLLGLDDGQLTKLSREGHLFLSLAEMKAVQGYFRELGREPTDVELETLAQTWSEHCVHKTLKSAVDVEVWDSAGKMVGSRRYENLIKETIFASTMELMEQRKEDPFCLSVFADNAGVVVFDEVDAVCFKAETHNHPSAIEPYGGSATGTGGVIRDILGTGLGAKPIANTDVFCVAYPNYGEVVNKEDLYRKLEAKIAASLRGAILAGANDKINIAVDRHTGAISGTHDGVEIPTTVLGRNGAQAVKELMQRLISPLPKGVIHPKRVLQQVVAGVRDYGNRMGIPTVNGAVYFDDRYIGNPLVFCGCIGLIPRDKISKAARSGDAIVVVGGRTGRDGIHGATFSSAELTDTHADEFSHAVQIGNAITEKKVADVILRARDLNLFSGITDCGAGGLSSAIGEMGEKTGALVELEKVPLKYAGLRYDEIWISEAQERMVLSVPGDRVEALLKLAGGEDVEATVIGEFGTPGRELVLNYRGVEVGRMSMGFMHDGIPMPTRRAVVQERMRTSNAEHRTLNVEWKKELLATLAHPNIASKHWIIRQYDHEVQGGSVVKPLVGPLQRGPSDAAVVRPKLSSYSGVAIGCGLAPHIADPYEMAIAAIDEAIRNVICVGADYERIAILDNFCWPSVDDELTMGTLVRACEACRDAAMAFEIPFISGKDSLHNQFTNQETGEVTKILPTLLISAMGIVGDVHKCITMDLKGAGNVVFLVSATDPDLASLAQLHRAMSKAIRAGAILSAHDVSDGGVAVTAAEMCIASGLGIRVESASFGFAEKTGNYLVEVCSVEALEVMISGGANVERFGVVQKMPALVFGGVEIAVETMAAAWRGTLDW